MPLSYIERGIFVVSDNFLAIVANIQGNLVSSQRTNLHNDSEEMDMKYSYLELLRSTAETSKKLESIDWRKKSPRW